MGARQTALTEKQKAFCREYVRNGGNGTEAYLTAYDSQSKTSASIESSKLLRRDDVTEYIATLNKPFENRIQNEREKKRTIIWQRLQHCIDNGDESNAVRWMDMLNRLDSDYMQITKNIEEKSGEIVQLDTDTLKRIAGTA